MSRLREIAKQVVADHDERLQRLRRIAAQIVSERTPEEQREAEQRRPK